MKPHKTNQQNALPQPPAITNRLVQYILSFSVSVAVGLAPYLGKLEIPFFTPLLVLIPESIQDIIIPLSAALMGVVAIITQWYANEQMSKKHARKFFIRTLFSALASLLILIIAHPFVVATVRVGAELKPVSFVVGYVMPAKPPCKDMSPEKCIEHLTFDDGEIKSYWGKGQIGIATLSLMLPYLWFMSSFGMMVGLLLLRRKI